MIRLRRSSSFASLCLAVPALVATLAVAPLARADALPPNACDGVNPVAGSACSTAGDGSQDGICVSSTCHSISGGSYPCELCELVDAGPAPVDAGPKDATVGPDADASTVVETDGSVVATDASVFVDSGADGAVAPPATTSLASSCTVARAPGARGDGGSGTLFVLGVLGMITGAASRRRRA